LGHWPDLVSQVLEFFAPNPGFVYGLSAVPIADGLPYGVTNQAAGVPLSMWCNDVMARLVGV
jgi:hypothetical protein